MRIIIVFSIILCSFNAYAATYYMANNPCSGNAGWGNGSDSNAGTKAEPFLTLQYAFTQMSAGDTLIIDDGIYTGSSNVITESNAPPNGNYGADETNLTADDVWTTVQAENEGKVEFDGESTRNMFAVTWTPIRTYIIFRGLKWKNGTGSLVQTTYMEYVKFIRCGTTGTTGTTTGVSNWYLSRCSYILLEECYAWGTGGRYKFQAYLSDHIIFRRCVGRTDQLTTSSVTATFQNYCSQYVEYQNCISIDCDSLAYWSGYTYLEGGFTMHETYSGESSTNFNYRGCIVLNHSSTGFTQQDSGVENVGMVNSIAWDTGDDGIEGAQSATGVTFSHLTFGANTGDAWDNSWGSGSYNDLYDSIIYGSSNTGIHATASSTIDYNCVYGNVDDYNGISAGTHDYSAEGGNSTVDPIDGTPGNGTTALKYLVRIEDSSDLDGAGSDSGDIGATILKRIGVSETMYGETGYNTTTDDDLWPFPYEEQIKTDFSTYNPGGADETKPDGLRGFCSTGNQLDGETEITLTSYIWEYLGNQMPSDIYGGSIATSGVSLSGVTFGGD